MGDIPAPNALYPSAPQQAPASANLLADPAKAIGILSGIQDYRLKSQQFDALAQQPAASLQGQNISNATAEMQQQEGASRAVSRIMGGYLAGIPKPSADDVRSAAAFAARSLPNVAVKYPDIISAASETGRRNPGLLINSGLSPEGQSSEVTGTPLAGGQPTILKTPASNMGLGRVVGLGSGAGDALAESQKSLVEDQKASARTVANLRNLDIALPAIEKLSNPNFGPGSSQFASLKGSLITAGIIDPKTSDVTVRQEIGKYLLKYATMAQNAGRSDQALGAALGSNPNLDLTQPANLGLIKNQIGLDKMDAALPKIFKAEHPGEDERTQYNSYKSDYYDRFDRRVFSYDKLSPEERRDLVQSLGGKNSAAYKKFDQTYKLAKQAGIITPEKQ